MPANAAATASKARRTQGPEPEVDTAQLLDALKAFRRGDFVCVANTTGAPVTVPAYGRVLITSGEVEETGGEAVVAADTTVWWTTA